MPNVRVPIMNLFSGVARQPSSKRLTSELEEVENAILTLERSAEKRPPLEFIHGGTEGGFLGAFLSDGWDGSASPNVTHPSDDIAYFFFDKNEVERYIIIINRSVAHKDSGLVKIFKFRECTAAEASGQEAHSVAFKNPKLSTGDVIVEEAYYGADPSTGKPQTLDYSKVNPNNTTSGIPDYTNLTNYAVTGASGGYIDDVWEYVSYNPESKPARECLKATFFGSAVMILNKYVPACTWSTADIKTGGNYVWNNAKKLTYRVSRVPDKTGDYIMGGAYNDDTDVHEPVGGCSAAHPITLFKGADGNGNIELSDFKCSNVSDASGTGTLHINLTHYSGTINTIEDLVTALNHSSVTDDEDGNQITLSTHAGTFYLDEGSGSSTPPGTGPYTGKLYFKTANQGGGGAGTDIVQFFDGNGNTATHLGLTGTTGIFDGARKTGKNLQPYLADTSTVATTNYLSAPLNSFGGASHNTANDVITITENGTSYVWNIGTTSGWTSTDPAVQPNWAELRADLEAELSGFTLTLNATKDGAYITANGTIAGTTAGQLPDSVVDTAGDAALRLGMKYDKGMHKPVREDKSVSADIFETELGQNISSFNAIEIPPEGNDVNRVNGEEQALADLYGWKYSGNTALGFGKVWYARSGFLTFPQGFYRCVSNDEIPHYHKVRAEDEYSVWYEASFPFLITNTGDSTWDVEYPKWSPRETGNQLNNPGPQAFSLGDKKGVIKDIAFWRERLWFAVDDMVFSSRSNDWFDLWLEDPNNITSSDPIDIRASSGKYTRINFMIPFDDFMFINTGGETQYELQGSNNIISPTTAELAPTSFYSASAIIEPLVLGTQIYWFDDERLYLYNSSAGASVNNAIEVSIHANSYLPKNFRCACVAAAQDSIFVVDEDNPDHLYVYTSRWQGGQMAQSAFYKYVLPQTIVSRQITDHAHGGSADHEWETSTYWDGAKTTLPKPQIEYIWYSRNYLYMVVLRPVYDGTKMQRFVERTSLQFLDINTPRVDRLMLIRNNVAGSDNSTNDDTWYTAPNTHWRLPYWDPGASDIILGPNWPTQSGQRLSDTGSVSNTEDGDKPLTNLTVAGDWNGTGTAYNSYVGVPYTMKLELSRINYRDPSTGFPVEGTLALRMMNLKHFKTGVYDIEIARNSRTNMGQSIAGKSVTTHTPLSLNNSPDALGALLVENEGEFTTRVFGNSDTTTISVTSDYPSPLAITSIEFIGRFKPYNSSIQT